MRIDPYDIPIHFRLCLCSFLLGRRFGRNAESDWSSHRDTRGLSNWIWWLLGIWIKCLRRWRLWCCGLRCYIVSVDWIHRCKRFTVGFIITVLFYVILPRNTLLIRRWSYRRWKSWKTLEKFIDQINVQKEKICGSD